MVRAAWSWLAMGALVLWCACMTQLAQAHEPQQLKAIFLGRFASYVQWPDEDRSTFVIAVLGSHPLGQELGALYADKRIQNKPVRIYTIGSLEGLSALERPPDLLFVALPTAAARQDAIAYGQRHGVLTVSDAKGFAEQGGIIQIGFVEQSAHIKINYDAAIQTGLQIAAPLLSIATVLRKGSP